MARDKARIARKTIRPVRLQDGSGLEDRILQDIDVTLVQPIVERIELLEAELDALSARSGPQLATIELPFGRRDGSVILEPAEGFADDAIGAPVIMSQASSRDGVRLLVSGEVLNRRQMRVHFSCAGGAPRTAQVSYILGTQS
jgi:hypothetical protein